MVKEVVEETVSPSAKKPKLDETDKDSKDEMDLLNDPAEDIPEKKVLDPFQANLEQEDDEVARRSEKEDKKLFGEICQSLQNLMKEIVNIKNDKADGWQEELEERKVQVLMLVLSLRRLSRVQKVRARDARERTLNARQNVDTVTLGLQNLLYEVAHLKKEIKRCLDFYSGDKEIDLVDLNTFYNQAPEEIAKPAETLEDPHKQHLARLDWELQQRQAQTEQYDKLMEEKTLISSIISQHEKKLAALGPQINAILEATKPLQESLNLDFEEKREIKKQARLLPIPLYTLFVQVSSYAEVCDQSIKVEIKGDFNEAKKIADANEELEAIRKNTSMDEKQKERLLKQDEIRRAKAKLFDLHPLSVTVLIPDKSGNKVMLNFQYASTLRFVSAICRVDPAEKLKLHIEGVLNKDSFLECLFPDDYGMTCPNPAGTYLIKQSKLHFEDYLPAIGRPFTWVQTICGLSFMCDMPSTAKGSVANEESSKDDSTGALLTEIPKCKEIVSSQLSADHVGTIIESVRQRMKARIALHGQFANLLNSTCSTFSGIHVPDTLLKRHYPNLPSSKLMSWRPMVWADYELNTSTQNLRKSNLVTKHFMIYKALIEYNKDVRLDALVAVSPDHPKVTPLFTFNIHWKGRADSDSNPQLRVMENELNDHHKDLLKTEEERVYILPLLMYKTLECFDMYVKAFSAHLEEEGTFESFCKVKVFKTIPNSDGDVEEDMET